MTSANALSNLSVQGIEGQVVSYYFVDAPLDQSGRPDIQNSVARQDLPTGELQPGQSFKFQGPVYSQNPYYAVCLVSQNANGKILSTNCSSVQIDVSQLGKRPPRPPKPPGPTPTPEPEPSPVSTMTWWMWLIFVVLLVIILILGGALYSSRKCIANLKAGKPC